MAKIVLDPITSGYNLSKINHNFEEVVAELQNKVLYRDNPAGEPNLMNNDLDMNSNRILNLPAPTAATEVARLKDIQTMGATSLPEQTGHVGKFIQTDGEAASWQVPDASEISNTPAGEVEATTVQGAIDEIDTDLQGFKTTIASNVADGYVAKSGATGSAVVPTGTQAQRDATPSAGYFRFNSDTGKFEGYNASDWKAFVQLEDVGGSPGLPAVDGSQLTGVTTGSNVTIATITPATDADVTLALAQYTADVLVIETGAWTTARNIIVPDESRSWQVISNSTHAATVKTAAGTGVAVPAGQSRPLVCNGTNVVDPLDAYYEKSEIDGEVKIQSGVAVASTSGTAIDFTGIPSWAKRITVMFSGVSTNGATVPLVQIGDSVGIETAGYVSVTTGLLNSSGTTTTSVSSFVIRSAAASNTLYGHMILTKIDGNTWISSHSMAESSFTIQGAGAKTLSDTLDRVRITTANGTDVFDSGTINITWEG